jgi:hypothetical protein
VQADVNTNEADSDAADAALSTRLDVLEADPTTAAAVAAVQSDVDANEVSRKAVIDLESNITNVKNAVRGTSIAVGNNITLNPASGGRVEIEGDLLLDNETDVIDGAGVTLTSFTNINAYDGRLDTLEADPTTAAAVAAGDAATLSSANSYTDTSITNLVNGADAALDTLKEIGDALAAGDTSVTNALTAQITTESTARTAADTAIQADVDQNEADSDAADAALSGRLDTLEADPTTAAAVAAVQTDVDQNEADGDAADAALSSRLDTLEADPTTATAVAAVQADVDSIEAAAATARTNLQTALQNAIDAVQADVNTNEADADTALALKAALTGANFTGDLLLKKSDGSAVALRLSRTDSPDMNTEFKVQPSYVDINKECLNIMAGSAVIAAFDERQRVAINTTDPDHNLDVGGDGKFSTNLTVGAALNLSGGLTDAANDTAAAAAGVAVNQLYRNGSVVMIRVS